MSSGLLAQCHFADARTPADLAVSVDRTPSGCSCSLWRRDSSSPCTTWITTRVRRAARTPITFGRSVAQLDVGFIRHDVAVTVGANFEARARSARRAAMPRGYSPATRWTTR